MARLPSNQSRLSGRVKHHEVAIDRDFGRLGDDRARSLNPGAPPEHVPAPGLLAEAIDPLSASMSTIEPRRTEIRPMSTPLFPRCPDRSSRPQFGPRSGSFHLGGFPNKAREGKKVWEHTFLTAQPHAHVRFRRAIERRALWMAEDAARELPNLPLEDALQLVHLYFERGSPKAEPAARRWLVRYLSEGSPSLRDVAKVTASLAEARSRRAG